MRQFVESKTKVTSQGDMHKYSFQPGNGYKYEILVVNIHKDLELGVLGGISSGYLVVNGFTGMSYLLSSGGTHLTCDYVREKFFTHVYSPEEHVNAITALIARVLNRSSDASIDRMQLDPPA